MLESQQPDTRIRNKRLAEEMAYAAKPHWDKAHEAALKAEKAMAAVESLQDPEKQPALSRELNLRLNFGRAVTAMPVVSEEYWENAKQRFAEEQQDPPKSAP